MVVIRGVNLYPSAIENIVLRYPEIAEFQIEQHKVENMDEVTLTVELAAGVDDTLLHRLQDRLRDTFSLRIPVKLAPQAPCHVLSSRPSAGARFFNQEPVHQTAVEFRIVGTGPLTCGS